MIELRNAVGALIRLILVTAASTIWNPRLADSYPWLVGRVGDGFADQFFDHPRDVAFAEEQEVQVGSDGVRATSRR